MIFSDQTVNGRMPGLVISSQISLDNINLPENGTIELKFMIVSSLVGNKQLFSSHVKVSQMKAFLRSSMTSLYTVCTYLTASLVFFWLTFRFSNKNIKIILEQCYGMCLLCRSPYYEKMRWMPLVLLYLSRKLIQ